MSTDVLCAKFFNSEHEQERPDAFAGLTLETSPFGTSSPSCLVGTMDSGKAVTSLTAALAGNAFDDVVQSAPPSLDKHGFMPAADNSHGEGDQCNSAKQSAA